MVPDVLKDFIFANTGILLSIVVSIMIFILSIISARIFSGYIYRFILTLTKKTSAKLDKLLLHSFEKPLRFFFVTAGGYFALSSLPLKPAMDDFILKAFRSSVAAFVSWGLYNTADSSSEFAAGLGKRFRLDKILIPFFSKFFRFFIVMLAF